MKTLLALSGSSRHHSLNMQLLRKAAHLARNEGAVVEILDLRALDLPVYDGDFEAANGLPEGALTLQHAMREAHGLLIASPEYNSKPTPLLLNALDWASRPDGGDYLSVFQGKTAGLVSASPGALGGLRSLWALRSILQNVGVVVAPTLASVGGADQDLFQEDHFENSPHAKRVRATVRELVGITREEA